MQKRVSSTMVKPSADNRKVKRYSYRLKVFNQKTGEILGYIENISLCGMLLNSIEPIPDKEMIQIWFGAEKDKQEKEKIFLTVHKVWGSVSEQKPILYSSGLYYDSPSEDALSSIQALIDSIGG